MKRATSCFKTEAELCAAFIEWVKRQKGWTPYAETAEWDILLVHSDGTQVGVQAKMRLNFAVLGQAIEQGKWPRGTGPDFRVVLVPAWQGDIDICDALGLTLIRQSFYDDPKKFDPELGDRHSWRGWHYMNPVKRHELPKYVPDVPAGVPSPSPLTKWKIAALQICAVLELRGYITRQDFKNVDIDHRRWVDGWLEPVPAQPGRWRWRDGFSGWATQHPVVYPQVLADVKAKKLHLDAAGALF